MSFQSFDHSPIEPREPAGNLNDEAPAIGWRIWLDNRNFASKLRLAISLNVFVPILLAAAFLACILYLGQEGTIKAKTATAHIRIGHAALSLVKVERNSLILARRADGPALARLRDHADEAVRLLSLANTNEADEILPGMKQSLALFDGRVAGLYRRVKAIGPDTTSLEFKAIAKDAVALETDIEAFSREAHKYTAREGRALIEKVEFSAKISVLGAFLGILFTALLARKVICNLTRTVRAIADAMERLVKGEIDTPIPGSQRGDELGRIARSLNVFRESSRALGELSEARASDAEQQLEQQRALHAKTTSLRSEKSDLLESLAAQFEVSVGEVITSVSGAAEQLKTTSQAMASLSEISAEQSRSASTAMEVANVNVTAAAAATDEFALSINEISHQASGSAALARDASKLADAANSQMATLADAADEIGEIVELIRTIAQRTNLLALNASIEAARGGEAGRGFAVVASEVKDLANQTSAATHNVSERINAIQSSTNSSVDALTSIVIQIADLEQSSGVIASAVDQQSLSGEELARNIDVAASGSADVAIRLEKLLTASQETGGSVQEVLESAGELGRLAEEMREEASAFITDIRRSARDLADNNEAAA